MQGRTHRAILGRRLQRRLRHAMTDVERRLWSALRGRQLDGCKFRRQHPYFDYVLDFVCLERRLVVEVDGGQHNGSAADLEHDAFLVRGGFEVLRFWNHEVLQHLPEVADRILAALIRRRSHHPLPARQPPPPAAQRPRRDNALPFKGRVGWGWCSAMPQETPCSTRS